MAAQNNILGLEQRVRDLTRPDNLLEELVTRVRDSADQEMTMFKEESEEVRELYFETTEIQYNTIQYDTFSFSSDSFVQV